MPFEGNFVMYMARRSLDNYLFIFGFIFAIGAYSFWKPLEKTFNIENEGQLFYVGIAIAFMFYTLAFMVAKYKTWRWFPMFVVSVCSSRVFTELNPELAQQYDWMEYAVFLLTICVILFYYLKYKWDKFYGNKQ